MSDHQIRRLTDGEINALKNALSEVLVQIKKKSANVDSATDDPSKLDPLHGLFAAERKLAEELLDLLDRATGVQVDLPE
jgi:hypothetical protein